MEAESTFREGGVCLQNGQNTTKLVLIEGVVPCDSAGYLSELRIGARR